ncbi:MAG: PHP domain-containing protein [Acetobacteraceae bacterium]|nr:PHP domain-containing protein [Acetobacteraceae bacterium]
MHTSASDGTESPEAMVRRARALGFCALGIADHDTLDGLPAAESAARSEGLEVVPGVEINTDYQQREVHVLGYYPNLAHPPFLGLLRRLREGRTERLQRMLARLEEAGLPLSLERVLALAAGGPVGRPHVAQAMHERGYVRSIKEAFERYLGLGRPGYVERYRVTPQQAVEQILDARGVPVLAHPGLVARDELVVELVEVGLKGLEVYHPDHKPADVRRYLELAQRLGLLVTGGSDCHGPAAGRPALLGSVRIPYVLLEKLKEARVRLAS